MGAHRMPEAQSPRGQTQDSGEDPWNRSRARKPFGVSGNILQVHSAKRCWRQHLGLLSLADRPQTEWTLQDTRIASAAEHRHVSHTQHTRATYITYRQDIGQKHICAIMNSHGILNSSYQMYCKFGCPGKPIKSPKQLK